MLLVNRHRHTLIFFGKSDDAAAGELRIVSGVVGVRVVSIVSIAPVPEPDPNRQTPTQLAKVPVRAGAAKHGQVSCIMPDQAELHACKAQHNRRQCRPSGRRWEHDSNLRPKADLCATDQLTHQVVAMGAIEQPRRNDRR